MFLSTSEVVTQRSWGLRDVGLAALHKTPQTTAAAVTVKLLYPVLRGCPSRDRWDYVHLNLFCVSFKYYFHWILTCLLYAGVVPVWGQHLPRWHPRVLTVFENLLPHQRVLRRHRPLWVGPAPTHQPAGRGRCKGSQKNIDPPSSLFYSLSHVDERWCAVSGCADPPRPRSSSSGGVCPLCPHLHFYWLPHSSSAGCRLSGNTAASS